MRARSSEARYDRFGQPQACVAGREGQADRGASDERRPKAPKACSEGDPVEWSRPQGRMLGEPVQESLW
ncbi:MAG: hypothetical protein E6J34_16420 [Chloroflexi bacterium]|nr:MAG: hypothetical protein E6J34_16420 [Chloroflexota bacterium]